MCCHVKSQSRNSVGHVLFLGTCRDCLVVPIFICVHDKRRRRFSLLCVVVSDRSLKVVARSASRALGGKGNVALCLESETGRHASQHVSSHPYPFCPPPPLPLACFPWPTLDVITTHVNQTKLPPDPQQSQHIDSKQLCGQFLASVFSRTPAHILFMCAINLFLFFEHPVPFGWTSLINFKTHPIQRMRSGGGVLSYSIYSQSLNGNSD